MKIGVLIEGQEGLTWERWRRIVARAEQLGFESIWRSDHFTSLADPRRESLETWPALTLAAAETSRLRFGPLVCPITFRHPSMLARLAVSVDDLSGGRLVLGVGAGWNDVEHRKFGLPFPPARQRLEMLEEAIQVIVRLWGDEPASFEGRYYRLEGAELYPKPVQQPRIPLLIAGGGPRTLRIVAQYADEWDVSGGLSPADYKAKNEALNQYCREIGRDPAEILRSVSTAYLIGRNQAELLERAERIKRLMPSLTGIETSDVPAALRAHNWRVGTPEQIGDDLRALAEAGAERIILQHNDYDDFEALQLVSQLPTVHCPLPTDH